MEAMAYGKTVIMTSVAGAVELIPGRRGILITPGDPEAIADAVIDSWMKGNDVRGLEI